MNTITNASANIANSQIKSNISASDEERFWKKVAKNGPIPAHMPHLGNCWIWTSGLRGRPRDRRPNFHWNGRDVLGHRFSWILHNGAIPSGMEVCHHCDNRICIRPAHLFVGTHLQNMNDLRDKGLHKPARGDASGARKHPKIRQGENNGRAKLTEDQVREIRKMAKKTSRKDLRRLFGVSRTVIAYIIKFKSWRHVI